MKLNLLAWEMKRKVSLLFKDGVKAKQSVKLKRGLILTLSLQKTDTGKYWMLCLERKNTSPSDREVIICQNAFFAEPPLRRINTKDSVILIWKAKDEENTSSIVH